MLAAHQLRAAPDRHAALSAQTRVMASRRAPATRCAVSQPPRRVGVVGAGPAGLGLANALRCEMVTLGMKF